MTRPQLGSLTYFNGTSNTVTSETINRDLNLFHFGIPLTNLSENIALKTPFAVINISGEFIGTESNINLFITQMENAATVNQFEITYTSAINKSYDVKINNFTYTTSPNTTMVGYTLQLYVETL